MDHTEELGESQVKDLLFQAIGFLDATGIRAVGTRAPDTVRKILRDAKKLFEYPGTQTRIIWHLPTDESLSRDENLEKRQKWRAMIDALQAAGFVLSMDIKKGWVRTVLDSFTDIETIGWSLEKGLLKEPVLHRVAREREGHTDAHGLVMSLRKEGSGVLHVGEIARRRPGGRSRPVVWHHRFGLRGSVKVRAAFVRFGRAAGARPGHHPGVGQWTRAHRSLFGVVVAQRELRQKKASKSTRRSPKKSSRRS